MRACGAYDASATHLCITQHAVVSKQHQVRSTKCDDKYHVGVAEGQPEFEKRLAQGVTQLFQVEGVVGLGPEAEVQVWNLLYRIVDAASVLVTYS